MAEIRASTGQGSTRKDPVWLLWFASVLLALQVVTGIREYRNPPKMVEHVDWIAAAEAPGISARTGKPILYDFSATWCGPCKQMGKEVFGNRGYAAKINEGFVPVRIMDDEGDKKEKDILQARYSVKAFPTLVVVGVDGKEINRVQGYAGKENIMRFFSDSLAKAGKSFSIK